MRWAAQRLNEAGRRWQDRGYPGVAGAAYASAALLAPSWSAPWFNRGLLAKGQRRWSDSLKFNRRAAELDPDDPPAWWNLGIAATAIGQWTAARLAWTRYGIPVPPGEGPIEMDLGAVPIRLSPADQPEVVWCRRIDPARAVVLSIPTAGSGRGCGDLLLHDGEPTGSRLLQGRKVPVFDELELLLPGTRHTFAVEVLAPRPADVAELETGPDDVPVAIEDCRRPCRCSARPAAAGRPTIIRRRRSSGRRSAGWAWPRSRRAPRWRWCAPGPAAPPAVS